MTDPRDDARSEAERETEDFLRDLDGPAEARGAFRDGLRTQFTQGNLSGAPNPTSLSGQDARNAALMIEDLLTAGAPAPPAREAFREDLKARFLRGELIERPADPASGAGSASDSGPSRSPAFRLILGGLAAAAALWAIAQILLPDEPSWRGFKALGEGPVVVDGRELVPRDLSEVGGAFARASMIESRERRLELVREDELVLAVMPGTRLEKLSDGLGGELRFALHGGEVYLKTDPGYDGPAVVVETDDMDMVMTGTVVGVLKNEEISCICVERGTVDVTPRADQRPNVCEAGSTSQVAKEGLKLCCTLDEAAAHNSKHVQDLRAFARSGL